MVLQMHSPLEFSGVSITHRLGWPTTSSTSTRVADLSARLRRARVKALHAAFLHAERNQLAPQRSNRSLLSQS